MNYCNRKSMRIGLYGFANGHGQKGSLKIGLHEKRENEKRKESTPSSDEEMQHGNGHLIHNTNVPAAIITIKKPAPKHGRNCWAPNHRANGICSCSCHGCKWQKFEERTRRNGRKNRFRERAKKLRRVGDYGP